jgi:hypothetical protein
VGPFADHRARAIELFARERWGVSPFCRPVSGTCRWIGERACLVIGPLGSMAICVGRHQQSSKSNEEGLESSSNAKFCSKKKVVMPNASSEAMNLC